MNEHLDPIMRDALNAHAAAPMFCRTCNADHPPHAPGCLAVDLDRISREAKCNGLLMAKAIVLQAAIDAGTPEAREFAEHVVTLLTGAAYGCAPGASS